MGLFRRQMSPEQQAERARELLSTPEARAAFTIGGSGVPFDSGDWVNLYPSPNDDHATTSVSKAFTSTIAVYTCVSLIAESIASLPLLTYRRLDPDRRERVPEGNTTPGPKGWTNRLSRLLHYTPNQEMTAQELWETAIGHLLLWGNAYLNVVRENGRPVGLWPLRPDCMEIDRDDQKVRVYRYYLHSENRYVNLRPADIMHIRGLSLDGVLGISPITVARVAVAISRNAERHASRLWTQGGSPPGLLIADPPLKGSVEAQQDQLRMLKDGYTEMTGGLENAHRVGVLSGVKWQQVGMNLDDAQFLETRKFQLHDIARLYRVPPYKVGITEPGAVSYASVEQQAIEFVTDTLRPPIRRIEQAIDRDLGFPGTDAVTLNDEGLFAEFKVDALLRGDQKTRYEGYALGLQNKFLVVNDIRRWENLDPVEWGDTPNPMPGEGPGAEAARAALAKLFIPEPSTNGHSLTQGAE